MPSLIFWGVQMTLISISRILQFWHEQLRESVTNTTDWFNVFFDKIILLTHYTYSWLLFYRGGGGGLCNLKHFSAHVCILWIPQNYSLPLSWLVHAHKILNHLPLRSTSGIHTIPHTVLLIGTEVTTCCTDYLWGNLVCVWGNTSGSPTSATLNVHAEGPLE